ncbi:MAG TPA: hypothetical protein DDZ89_18705 [Clostridiales bacterium]|nr:hypothetical protein [Clostridiales bacterium]
MVQGCGIVTGEGNDVCLIAVDGLFEHANSINEQLSKEGIHGKVLNPRFLKPLDRKFYEARIMNSRMIVIMEETIEEGGFSQSAIIQLLKWGYKGKFKSFTLKNVIIPAGPRETLISEYGWTTQEMIDTIKKELHEP